MTSMASDWIIYGPLGEKILVTYIIVGPEGAEKELNWVFDQDFRNVADDHPSALRAAHVALKAVRSETRIPLGCFMMSFPWCPQAIHLVTDSECKPQRLLHLREIISS